MPRDFFRWQGFGPESAGTCWSRAYGSRQGEHLSVWLVMFSSDPTGFWCIWSTTVCTRHCHRLRRRDEHMDSRGSQSNPRRPVCVMTKVVGTPRYPWGQSSAEDVQLVLPEEVCVHYNMSTQSFASLIGVQGSDKNVSFCFSHDYTTILEERNKTHHCVLRDLKTFPPGAEGKIPTIKWTHTWAIGLGKCLTMTPK